MEFTRLACFVLLIGVSLGASLNKDCKGANLENLLEKHRHYTYRYHAQATAKSVGTTDLESKIDVKCLVQLQHTSQCLFHMEVQNCKLNAYEVNGEGKTVDTFVTDNNLEALTNHPIAFTLNDGEIRNVYVSDSDPLYSVNMKRGIASAFVNAKSDLGVTNPVHKVKVDVQGHCPVEVTPGEGGKTVITKDLDGCYLPSRKDYRLSPLAMFFNMSFIQHVINSTEECILSGNDGGNAIQSLHCHERHAIMLESTHNTATAVQTLIHYKLELEESSKKKGVPLELSDKKETGIIFEYEENSNSYHYEPEYLKQKVQNLLSDIIIVAKNEFHLDTLRQHRELVGLLRSSQESLTDITDSVLACDFTQDCSAESKKMILELYNYALLQCNTVPCLDAFADLVERKKLGLAEVNFAYMTLTNIHHIPHEYIGSVLRMCLARMDRFCYTTLGGLVNKYNEEQHLDSNSVLPKEILDTIQHISATLGPECALKNGKFPPGITNDKRLDYMTTILKTIGNMGSVYVMAEPSVVAHLGRCARNTELSPAAAVSAIEAYRKMPAIDEVSNELLNILNDETAGVELRLAAYNVLKPNFDTDVYKDSFATLLTNPETNSQVRGYLAMELRRARSDYYKKLAEKEIREKRSLSPDISHYEELANFDVDSVPISEISSSMKEVDEESIDLDFLHKGFETFGVHLESDIIFNSLSSFPQGIHSNLTAQVFGKIYQFVELGLQTGGWENVVSQIQTMVLTLKEPNLLQYWALVMQTLSQNRPTAKRRPSSAFELKSKVLLEKTIEDSISKLRQAYKASRKTMPPYLMASIRMLGNDLGFLTYEDIIGEIQKIYASITAGVRSDEKVREFRLSSTKVLDVIEAYHQFPTIMGLPLNWTTNASIGYSLRAGADVIGQQASADVNCHFSAGLTFLNRMVLDLPTVTNIGVQANSSAYTDTSLSASMSLTRGSGAKLSLKLNDRIQRPLELFRTNQFIKGGRYVEIEDHDIQRVTEKKCLPSIFEKLTGMKICEERTFANVSHLIKPWFPMAASAKMAIHVYKIDPELKSYDAEIAIEAKSKDPEKKINLKLTGPGLTETREVPIAIKINYDTNEGSVSVAHSDYPEFHLNLEQIKTGDGAKNKGYKTTLKGAYKKGKDYEMAYEEHQREEEREDVPTNRNLSPKKEKFTAKVDEREFKIKTPYNHYKYHSQIHQNLDNDKVDVHLTYENKDQSMNLLRKVLPKAFFENDHKAYIRMSGNYRHPQKRGKGGMSRQATSHITIPYSVIEINSHTIEDKDRYRLRLNVTKTETATKKVLAYFNVTSNYVKKTSSDITREVGDIDISIPRRNYKGKIIFENHRKGQELLTQLELIRAKTPVKGDEEVLNGDFDADEKRIVFEKRLKNRKGTDDDLTETVKKAMVTDFDDIAGLPAEFNDAHNLVTTADLRLSYPYNDKQENVDFNGTFKYIVTGSPAKYTFAKDFVMESSLHNLRLDSTSGFVRSDQTKLSLLHHSFFTNTATGSNQGKYNLRLQSARNAQQCAFFKMNHNIDAHFMQFSSNIDMKCQDGPPKVVDIVIDIDNVSPYLKELDLKLHQTFKIGNDGNEHMTATSNLADFEVTGDWSYDENRYNKKAVITSKIKDVPSLLIEINGEIRGEMVMTITPTSGDEKLKKLTVTRNVNFDHGTTLYYQVTHEEEGVDAPLRDFDMRVHIINSNEVVVNGKGDVKLAFYIAERLHKRRRQFLEYLEDKLSNPENELNTNLATYLETKSVRDYIDKVHRKAIDDSVHLASQFGEALDGLEPFLEPTLELVGNLIKNLDALEDRANEVFKQTYTGYFFYYFEIPQHFRHLVNNAPKLAEETIPEMLFDLKHLNDGKYTFSYTVHPIILKQLGKVPQLEKQKVHDTAYPLYNRLTSMVFDAARIQRMPQMGVDEKMAMIFGSNGVLTFDGKLYQAPDYPSDDCAFLLAHDVRGKSFSLLATKNKIHAIFPEMSVSIDDEGRVFANSTPSDSARPRSLPLVSYNGRISITRDDSETVSIKSPTLRVHCNSKSFHCIILLSSLHYAGTIGLLGDNNGEPSNDFTNAKGERLSSPVEMAQNFELSRQQICSRLYPAPTPDNEDSEEVKYQCKQRLEDARLSECAPLARIDKSSVERSCALDFASNPSNNRASCSTVDALVSLCSYHNVKGQGCETCPGISNKEGESTVKKAEGEVDLVLIVDEHKDNLKGGSSQVLKGIETLVTDIEQAFLGDFKEFRISLVGYGGQIGAERHPHLQTLGGTPYFGSADIPNLLKTLKFNGESEGDAIAAVEFANDALDFRPTASKIFLILSHNDEESRNPIKLQRLNALQKELNDNGVTLYTFSSYPMISKKKVYGLRADGLIFPNSGEDYMTYPKSQLAKLTSATRGSIFLSSYVESNVDSFFFAVSGEVRAKVGKEKNKCKKCHCGRNYLYTLRSRCHPVEC